MARPSFPFRKITGLTDQQNAELLRNFLAVVRRPEVISVDSIGDLIVSTSSPKRVKDGGDIRITADLSAGLTGSTTVDIKLDGTTVYTLTIASGATTADVLTGKRAKTGQVLTLAVTAVGTGSARALFDVIMSGD